MKKPGQAEIIRVSAYRGMAPLEIVAATGISKSVVYRVLNGDRVSGGGDTREVFTCPRDWPADPAKYRAGVAS